MQERQKVTIEQGPPLLVRDLTARSQNKEKSDYQPSQPVVIFSPRKIALSLVTVSFILILAYTVSQLTGYFTNHFSQFGLVHLFNLDEENNIPTWFSSLLLTVCALLLALIGYQKKQQTDPYAIHWLALAAVFVYMSMDETASIHELPNGPLRNALHVSEIGYLRETWVILAGLLVLIVGVSYRRFLIALPIKTRSLFMLAAGLYVGGAVGVEMIRATTYPYDTHTLTYIIGGLCEEGLEMVGLVLFVYALSSYLSSEIGEMRIRFRDKVL